MSNFNIKDNQISSNNSYKTAKEKFIKEDYSEAINFCKKLIDNQSCDYRVYNLLANKLMDEKKYKEAEIYLGLSIKREPKIALSYLNLANVMKSLNYPFTSVVSNYEKAINLKPNFSDAILFYAFYLQSNSFFEDALKNYSLLNIPIAFEKRLECLYYLNDKILLSNYIEFLDKEMPCNQNVACMVNFIKKQIKIKSIYNFCPEPFKYLKIENIKNYFSENYFEDLIKDTNSIKILEQEGNTATRLGKQSINTLFNYKCDSISRLKKILELKINDYKNSFSNSNCRFIESFPSQFKFNSWFVDLQKDGYQLPHIHMNGWLSGVFYPEDVPESSSEYGYIKFSLRAFDMPEKKAYTSKTHRPKKGDLVLFPSCLTHSTIPNNNSDQRLSIAFDAVAN